MTLKIKYITLAVMQVLFARRSGIPYYFAGNLIGITVIRAGG
ncbi:type 1 fimbriae anchoring protein FimD [Klebsiella michiganensis]|uniref:Type 1 fimbriae anchoring protein FimD n=1 Tax=Klebsiella michiganensis TaxID=1134687 RepID=A0A7H4PEG3_9ENTR|nr:type 1 fimbriae anchoring protein FimD [Klebsiella michiganensis]